MLFMKVCDLTAYNMQRNSSQKLLLITRRKIECNNHLYLGKNVLPSVLTIVQCWNNLYVSENYVACLVPD